MFCKLKFFLREILDIFSLPCLKILTNDIVEFWFSCLCLLFHNVCIDQICLTYIWLVNSIPIKLEKKKLLGILSHKKNHKFSIKACIKKEGNQLLPQKAPYTLNISSELCSASTIAQGGLEGYFLRRTVSSEMSKPQSFYVMSGWCLPSYSDLMSGMGWLSQSVWDKFFQNLL